MFDGCFAEYVLMHPNIRPYPQFPQETEGTKPDSKTYVRYSLADSDYPTLIIVDPIFDNEGNVIRPGYYELALSDNQDFLLLIQSKEAVAVIPVFRVEEDAKEPERDKTSILEEEDLGGIPEIKSNKKEKDKKTPGERRAERLKKAREEREKRRREREAAAAAEPEDIDDILEEELAAEDTTADSAYAERRRKRLERAERRRAEGKKYKENTEDIKELLPEDQAETSGDNIPMVKEDQRSFFLDPDGESFDEITSEDIGDHLDK